MVKLKIVIAAASLSGCFVPADTLVNVQGVVMDQDGNIYESCQYAITEGARQVFSFQSSGEFRESVVLGGFNYNVSRLIISCNGSREISLPIPAAPKTISEYISFGRVVIERQDETRGTGAPR